MAGVIPVSVLGGVPISAGPAATPRSPAWQHGKRRWSRLGKKWCAYRDTQDASGNFEGWGWEADAWFYDGGRVFQQIDDYTANVLNNRTMPTGSTVRKRSCIRMPTTWWRTTGACRASRSSRMG